MRLFRQFCAHSELFRKIEGIKRLQSSYCLASIYQIQQTNRAHT